MLKTKTPKDLRDTKILLVDDEDMMAFAIERELEDRGAEVSRGSSIKEGLRQFHSILPDLAIVDLSLPDGNGMDLVKKWRVEFPNIPVIVITAFAGVDSAIEAVRSHAFDYLRKPFEMTDLVASVTKACEVAKLREKVRRMQGQKAQPSQLNIIGDSATISRMKDALHKVAQSPVDTILIQGESGSGKELAARATHNWSGKAGEPFIEINCASIPENLLESELFGFERGAFTDARERKLGLFEIAQGGTIFLDEIGEMPLKLQAKLLRVLEYRSFKRLGGTKDITFGARIVAATNRSLAKEVAEGRFRSDLFYRLAVIDIQVPALREHPEDIPILAQYFLKEFAEKFATGPKDFAPETLNHLKAHSWPGNIRELRNLMQRALVLHSEVTILKPEHCQFIQLPPQPDQPQATPTGSRNLWPTTNQSHDMAATPAERKITLPRSGICLDNVEKELIVQALAMTKYNQTKAAKLLGVSRHTLRYRLEKHALMDTPNPGEGHA